MIPKKTTKIVRIPLDAAIERRGPAVAIKIGDLSATRSTIDEATQAITGYIADSLTIEYPEYRRAGSTLFVLYRTLDVWNYDIMRPGYDRPSSCVLGRISKHEAIKTMESHVAQELADIAGSTDAAD